MIDYRSIWQRFFSDDVNEIGQATNACVYAFIKKFEEVDARLDSIDAALQALSKAETKTNPSSIVPNIEISKESIKQARNELIRELQKEISR